MMNLKKIDVEEILEDWRRLCKKRKWSKRKAAKKINFSFSYLAEVERRTKPPSERLLKEMVFLIYTKAPDKQFFWVDG